MAKSNKETEVARKPRKQSESKQLRAYIALEAFIADAQLRQEAINALRSKGLF